MCVLCEVLWQEYAELFYYYAICMYVYIKVYENNNKFAFRKNQKFLHTIHLALQQELSPTTAVKPFRFIKIDRPL